jgi:hypothetical protein
MNKLILLSIMAILSIGTVNAQQTNSSKVLRHVVLFKFKDNTTPADIKKVTDAFEKLPTQISQIKAFEWGVNNSPEKINEGLTHCFFVTFSSEKDRDDYLVHPSHKAFVDILKPFLDKPVVVDYWTN